MAKLGALMMKGVGERLRKRLDYASYGGAPLLGVNGVVMIAHGKSSVRAIENAIYLAQRFVKYGVNNEIAGRFKGQVNNVAEVS